MSSPSEDGVSEGHASPTPPHSARVRLEVAVLGDDYEAESAPIPSTSDERARVKVLVVAAEADLRAYVRECLRERIDVGLVEAATIASAVGAAARHSPVLLIVDDLQRAIVDALPRYPALVIVDDVPRDAEPVDTRIRSIVRPFTSDELLSAVGRVLG